MIMEALEVTSLLRQSPLSLKNNGLYPWAAHRPLDAVRSCDP